jgi:hypothetical protein
LINALTSTIRTVFPSVYIMDVPGSFNSLVYATVRPTEVANLYRNYALLQGQAGVPALLLEAMQTTIVMMQPTPAGEGVVYTDDWAPVEWLTNNMVLNFVLFGNMEILQ